ncbi:MAG TPA: methyltransferase domain-containing protein [Kineosporiaceae bacterium]|nr:methyltransferase domain-containing protein [Kineosporiaceae bacterium]
MSAAEGYLLDNRRPEAGTRFAAFAELFDPWTFAHLDRLGLGPGARCWEVGAGGTSVPLGLAERAGPTGRVLATDIDLSWLAEGATSAAPDPAAGDDAPGDPPGEAVCGRRAAVEIRRHDVGQDAPPGEQFDLVHARLVLVHVPAREQALRSMASTVRPGGWLIVEDADPALQPLLCLEESGPDQELANRLRRGFRSLLAGRGADLAFGRRLPRLLRECGLVDVAADAYFPVASPACDVLEAATVEHVRGQLVGHGLATDEEIDRHLANVRAGRIDASTSPLISAWGRRPT